ncbi:hypothetical protein [Pedobacter sp. UBA4863]|uniref:hypothetical protein n=1 Tax=Pedobacter sp. UBA4863 TaxID=1947060 RepID=UPI0025F1BB04|nr:hypothetical protein [Pedobacter sp. UBA4863]
MLIGQLVNALGCVACYDKVRMLRAGGAKAALLVFRINTLKQKEMKTLGTAIFTTMTCKFNLQLMLAALALLLTPSLYFLGSLLKLNILGNPCISTYAPKRVVKKVVHHCKFSTFPINPNSPYRLFGKGRPKYWWYKGLQRGLLKDKH